MPVVWLIDAYRAGERGQLQALAAALGWPVEVKRLSYRRHVFLPHVLGHATLRGITASSAELLRPPWPDLVISCGVRNEPVCRWIRARSGGRTRYVHVGRPWAALDTFDLVITTPQYRVPDRSNVLNNTLTLHGVTAQRLEQARARWASTFAGLPRPLTAVIAGGDSGPFTLGPRAAARLAQLSCGLVRESGGALLVSTSARTSPGAARALRAGMAVPHYFYHWQPGDTANPYLGMLAWADRVVVTGDSIGMISEACATGKPVRLFDPGGMRAASGPPLDFRPGATLYGALMRWCWQPLTRDITLVHKQVLASGRASWLDEETSGEEAPGERGAVAPSEMGRAVASVRRLLTLT
jgi:mitochondrial fission protein ELM1